MPGCVTTGCVVGDAVTTGCVAGGWVTTVELAVAGALAGWPVGLGVVVGELVGPVLGEVTGPVVGEVTGAVLGELVGAADATASKILVLVVDAAIGAELSTSMATMSLGAEPQAPKIKTIDRAAPEQNERLRATGTCRL